jgi:hypothetical protein
MPNLNLNVQEDASGTEWEFVGLSKIDFSNVDSVLFDTIGIGTLTTAKASTTEDTNVQQIVNVVQNIDVGEDNTVGAGYFKTANGIDQTGQLATFMVRTALAYDVFDAYGVQSHIDINDDMGANAAGNVAAISGKVDINDNTVSAGILHAGLFIIDGATSGAVSGDCDVIWTHIESGVPASQVSSLIRMSTGSTVNAGLRVNPTNMTNFIDFEAVADCLSADTGAIPGTSTHKIKIDINGTAGYIPVVADY